MNLFYEMFLKAKLWWLQVELLTLQSQLSQRGSAVCLEERVKELVGRLSITVCCDRSCSCRR